MIYPRIFFLFFFGNHVRVWVYRIRVWYVSPRNVKRSNLLS